MENISSETVYRGSEIENGSEKKNFFVKIPKDKLDLATLNKIDFSTVSFLDKNQAENFFKEPKIKHESEVLVQLTIDPLYLVMKEKVDYSNGRPCFVETETIANDVPEYRMEIISDEPGDEVRISMGYDPWSNRERFKKVKRVMEYKSKDFVEVRTKYLERERIRESEKEPQYESVYIAVPKNKLKTILEEGLKTSKNESLGRNYDLELIFKRSAKKYMPGGSDRTNCIFAYPVDPRSMELGGLKSDIDTVVLKTMVDAKKVVVANGAFVSDAWDAYNGGGEADYYADKYWLGSMSLKNYLQNNIKTTIEYSPEVLIFEDIKPEKIELM